MTTPIRNQVGAAISIKRTCSGVRFPRPYRTLKSGATHPATMIATAKVLMKVAVIFAFSFS